MIMYKIEKKGTPFEIKNYPWDENGYRPKTVITIGYDEDGFSVHFVSEETKLRAAETQHNTAVHKDSCMEIYMQFAPQTDKSYINIEVNPNGAVYSSVSTSREISRKISPEDIETLGVSTKVHDYGWEVNYYIPKQYITKYIPSYVHECGAVLKGNFYKCGDLTVHPHFGCFADIIWKEPDFHRPEFFTDFKLV